MTGQEIRTWAEIARDDAGDAAKELVDEFLSKALEHRSGAGLGALLHKALDDHLDLESWSHDALRGINDKAAEVVGGHYYLLIHYLFVRDTAKREQLRGFACTDSDLRHAYDIELQLRTAPPKKVVTDPAVHVVTNCSRCGQTRQEWRLGGCPDKWCAFWRKPGKGPIDALLAQIEGQK